MHKLLAIFILSIVSFNLLHCHPTQSTLQASAISGFDQSTSDHIIFLNLKIRDGGNGKNEIVKLVSATSGKGRMKNLRAPVHYPYQIRAIPRYNVSHPETEVILEHPLFRSAEVADQGGTLSKTSVISKEGVLSLRFQYDSAMERIEFYSITPERGSVKIYTLNLKI